MRESNPNIKWREVPYNEKCEVTDRINGRLNQEGIPAVEIELIGWRMSRVFGNLKHAECTYIYLSDIYASLVLIQCS
jgi:hypothetical protein